MVEHLKTLLVGCGGMAGAWLDVASKDEDLEIAGLMDIRLEAAEKRQEDFELPEAATFDDLEEAVEAVEPDVVFDCTVPEAHYEVTMRSLQAGCHVMGEKPLADSMAHGREMVQAAQDADRIFAVMQNRRYLPTAPAMAGLVQGGQLGKITTANVDFYIGAHFSGFRVEMDHPLLLDMAIHTFDQARQFIGADPISVYCETFNPEGSWYKANASAMCVFRMTDDIVFNYRGSWCSEGFNSPWAGNWRVVGEKGTALWAEDTPRAEVVREEEGFMREMVQITSEESALEVTGHEACINEFLRCVREGGRPQTDSEDNIKSLAMVFGAIESSAKGEPVEIEV
ncbi:MAG: Gfo/Idh/MocA family oxidoreductase [Planctomycetes bacterium]|nr:Gfo/Idh/MocA family oxidoreductase [Planctomycetota bacterium]